MRRNNQGFVYILLIIFLVPTAIAITYVVKKNMPPSQPKPSESKERPFSPSLFEQLLEKGKETITKPKVEQISTPTPTLSPIPTPPTTGAVEGHIRKASGKGVGYVLVTIFCDCTTLRGGPMEAMQADKNGYYRFDGILPGKYRIRGGNWSDIYDFSIEVGKTTTVDISLPPEPTNVPETTIISGPALRTDPGDPPNLYCTRVKITVQICCQQIKVAMAYDNPNPLYVSLIEKCTSGQERYICNVLSPGQHTFYYHALNEDCAEEPIKSVSFTVP